MSRASDRKDLATRWRVGYRRLARIVTAMHWVSTVTLVLLAFVLTGAAFTLAHR